MIVKSASLATLSIIMLFLLKSCIDQGAISSTDSEDVHSAQGEGQISPSNELPDAALKVELSLGTVSDDKVNRKLYGFNTQALFAHYNNESSGLELIKTLEPYLLRFPGGTNSNFYHFDRPGYGYSLNDAETVKGSNAYQNTLNSAKRDLSEIKAQGRTGNFAQDMVRLAEECGASMVLVTNHLTGSLDENFRMIQYFKDAGVNVAGVELGNEYYMNAYKDKFPDVKAYINAVRPLAIKIRSTYPDIPIAVVAAPIPEMKEMNDKRVASFDSWNTTLAKENFYDSYVVHMYAKNKNCDQRSDARSVGECYLVQNLEYIHTTLPQTFKAYASIFSNKNLWLTEWNVKDVFNGLGNTMLQSLYFAELSLSLSTEPDVELAVYHNLLSGGTGFNVIGKEHGKEEFVKNAAYHACELVSPVFRNETRILSGSFNSDDTHVPCTTYAFKQGKNTLVYLINHGSDGFIFSLKDIAGHDGGSYSIQTIYADSPMDPESKLKVHNEKIEQLSSIAIPGYSINLISTSDL